MTTKPVPSISQTEIERWVGADSLRKGQSYFRQKRIFQARREGQALQALCRGSQDAPYEVEVTLSADGITQASCSCPVGGGGRCKHVAALLLTWLDDPGAFAEGDAIEALLMKRSKDELIDLVRRMIDHDPDLKFFLELPLPTQKDLHKPLQADAIRKQVEHAFRSGVETGWPDPSQAARDLKPLVDLAEAYARQQEVANAALVYQEINAGLLRYPNALLRDDEQFDLWPTLWQAVQGLDECLPNLIAAEQRSAALRALFDVYAWDIRSTGGGDISSEIADTFLMQAEPAEVQQIVRWIEAVLPAGDDWSDNYRRQILGALLLTLQEQNLDDEGFLALCRQTGRLGDLVDRLLALGRSAEAIQDARRAGDYDLLGLADIFVHHNQGSLAHDLIAERAATSKDTRLREWLKGYARQQGDLDEALEQAIQIHQMRPTIETYIEIRDLAEPLHQWQPLRAKTLDSLNRAGQYSLITEIYLAEGDIDQALSALEKARVASPYWTPANLILQVAEAAGIPRPRDAIRLYVQLAEGLIAQRGREKYVQAAAYLRQARELYHRLGKLPEWDTIIAGLRDRNRNLRAMQEELKNAGL